MNKGDSQHFNALDLIIPQILFNQIEPHNSYYLDVLELIISKALEKLTQNSIAAKTSVLKKISSTKPPMGHRVQQAQFWRKHTKTTTFGELESSIINT